MSDYVFLEHALNADGVDSIHEKNSSLIDHTVIVMDELVEAEHSFVKDHLGQFIVHEDLEETYDKIQDPVGDLVIEAVNYFSMVIANENMSVEEKTDMIELGATALAFEGDPTAFFEDDSAAAAASDMFGAIVDRAHRIWSDMPTPSEAIKMGAEKGKSLAESDLSIFQKAWMAIVQFFTEMKADVSHLGSDISKSYNEIVGYFKNTDFLADPDKLNIQEVSKLSSKIDSGLVKDLAAADYIPDWASKYLQDAMDWLRQFASHHGTDLTGEGAFLAISVTVGVVVLIVGILLVYAIFKVIGKMKGAKHMSSLRKAATGLFKMGKLANA